MRRIPSRRVTAYGALAVVGAAAIVFGLNEVYGFLNSSASSAGVQRTATVTRGIVQSSVSASGNVSAASSASADFGTSGTLSSIDVKVGDSVKAGQVLATIDPTSAKNALATAEANLAQAKSTLATAEAGLTAEQRASNVVSLQQAESSLTTSRQQVTSARSALADAKAQLAADKRLNCPPSAAATSGSSSNLSAGASSGAGSSSGGGSSGAAGSETSSGGASSGSGSSGAAGGAGSNGSGSSGSGSGSAGLGSGSGSSGSGSSGSGSSTAGSSGPAGGSGSAASSNGSSSSSSSGSQAAGASAGGASSGASSTSPASGSSAAPGIQNGLASIARSASADAASQLTDTTITTTTTTAPTTTTAAPPVTATTGQATSVTATTALLGGSVNPLGQDTSYHFEFGTSPTSLGSVTPTLDAGSGTGAVPVTAPLSNLTPNQSFLFRLVATNSSGTFYGSLALFTTSKLLSATTGQATSITTTTATVGGTVSPGGIDTSYHFEYGATPNSLTLATPTLDAGSGTGAVPVTASLTGLTPGQSYVFRLVATSPAGTSDGDLGLFTTSARTVSVSTGQATSITATAATLNGSVTPGGLDTKIHFDYGTSTAKLDRHTATADAGSSTGAVPLTASLTGLTAGQSYVFRLVAVSSAGTTEGGLTMFTTGTRAVAATTGQASDISATTATLNGSVTPGGLDTKYHFDYGPSISRLDRHTAILDAGSTSDTIPVTAPLTGLSPSRTYAYRLVAVNSSGTTNGALTLFTTSAPALAASTGQATSVGSTTATLSGTVDPGGVDTKYRFEYGTSASRFASATVAGDAGSGSGSVQVTATLNGLEADKTYVFRLVATNSLGTSDGVQATFTTTEAGAPTVVTGSATDPLTTTATLAGTVDPNGTDTTYWFEYGPTSAYGSKTAPVDAGSGTSAAQVTATITGLRPNTSYLYRLVARNAFGTGLGIPEVAKTSETSCVSDASTITSDEQTLEQQESALKTAEASLEQTKASIAAGETPSAATLAQDRAAVTQDAASVSDDRKALAGTTLRAPIAGTITAVNGSVGGTTSGSGSTVTPSSSSSSTASSSGAGAGAGAGSGGSSSSSGLFTIDTLHTLVIDAGFAEADASRLAVGQPATITFPALTNTEVAGKVIAVSSTSTVVSNVVTYDITIELVNPPSEIKEGMTANVSVVDQSRRNVLELPSSAITTNGAVSTVQLLENGKTTVTPVTIGLVGNSSTEVVSGLKAGAVVVEPTVTISAASSTATAGGFAGGGLGGGAFGGGGGAVFRGGG